MNTFSTSADACTFPEGSAKRQISAEKCWLF
jgi:hypothetical protein